MGVSDLGLANRGLTSLIKDATVASFIKEVNPRLAKRALKTNGRLANPEVTFLVKEALAIWVANFHISAYNTG